MILQKGLHAISLKLIFLIILLQLLVIMGVAQNISGQVFEEGGKPLPFATIKFGRTNEGMIADLDGKFVFQNKKAVDFIEVSYLNYASQKIILNEGNNLKIILKPAPVNLNAVVVKTTGSKLKRILNNAISNRDRHNPDKYDWYSCKVYYKMVADFLVPDSILKKDTSDGRILEKIIKEQHMLMTETYSRRTWQKPAKLQEDVIATRISGFKKAIFSSLVTDVLPFHAYNDFINLNGKDYNNPISKGLYQRFNFKLNDEIIQGGDTVWVINFQPKKNSADLNGTVYINSDGFAISQLLAHAIDSNLHRDIGIEQQYSKQGDKWFPKQLNYILNWQLEPGNEINMKGVSVLDSVSFVKNQQFKFDKAHTTRLLPNADERRDSLWRQLRPIDLQPREVRTYQFLDSVADKKKLDKYVIYLEKFIEGKVPVGKFDVNLNRLYTYNAYEKSRFGLGLQTNDKISKSFSVGAWAGYGTKDRNWKYGAFAEFYADRYKEFVFSGSYYNDLRDPGRLQVHKDLDKNYLRMFLMSRVDKVEGWSLSVQKRLGYLSAEIRGTSEKIQPQYSYTFEKGSQGYNSFSVKEASLNLRYAYGETTTPVFGRYYNTGTRYPVVYGRISRGEISNTNIIYSQLLGAISWQKNINRIGKENFLLVAGTTFSKQQLPLSKLFAGNGFLAETRAVYFFGGMQTMRPYDYYSDRFINFYWMHNFNWRLFQLKSPKSSFSSAPSPSIGHNVLWGSMKTIQAHKGVGFSVPEKPYHETGLLLNNIIRVKVMGLYYAGLNVGYFYHWTPTAFNKDNGRFVFGFGIDY